MRLVRLTALLALLLAGVSLAFAEVEHGRIAYRSAERVFLTLGSVEGVSVGDTVRVERDGVLVGRLVLEHVADDRASAYPAALPLESFHVGDEVIAVVAGRQERELDGGTETTVRPVLPSVEPLPLQVSSPPLTRGRVSLQTWAISDLSGSGYTWLQPSLLLTMAGRGGSTQHSFLLRVDRRFGESGIVRDRDLRVYHAWVGLTSGWPGSPALRLGRLDVPLVGGAGLVDGGLASFSPRRGFEVGVIGGKTPELQLKGLRSEGSKFAAYGTVSGGEWGDTRYQTGLAWVRESLDAGLDREWIVQNGNLQLGRRFSLSTGLELDLAAADSLGDSGSTQLSSGWVSMRIRVNRSSSWTLRGNVLKFVRRLETHRSVPDSLWDDAQRYGVYSSFSSRVGAVRWSGGLGVRNKERTSMLMFSGFARMVHESPPLFDRMGGQFRFIRNLFLDAAGFDLYAEQRFTPSTSLRLNGGVWMYGYGDAEVTWLVRPKLEAELNWSKRRRWFLTSSIGVEADPDSPLLYGFFELQRSF